MRKIPRDPFEPDVTLPPERTWALRSSACPPDRPREGADVFDVFSRNVRAGLSGVPYRAW